LKWGQRKPIQSDVFYLTGKEAVLEFKRYFRILTHYKFIVFTLTCVLILIILMYSVFLFIPNQLPAGTDFIEIAVEPGMTPSEMADLLQDRGVIRNGSSFLWGGKLIGVTRKLQAGLYGFTGTQNNYRVLMKLYRGEIIAQRVTFPEGTRITKIASILKSHFDIDSTYFVDLAMHSALYQEYDLPVQSLEGYLYPDTYHFSPNVTAVEVIDRMISRFFEIFSDSLFERTREIGSTLHKVITMASIVEGEAAIDTERADIAALYYNRLKKRMMLQADPTIQYIIPDGPRRLLKKDLLVESPYNTYKKWGLPPGPVNNPGIRSILAVLYPSDAEYLYMVANGDGSHTFSCTLKDHLKAKRKFDRLRKLVNHSSR